jgi:hypothetical protein
MAKGFGSQVTGCFVVPPRKDTLIWCFRFVINGQLLKRRSNKKLSAIHYQLTNYAWA